MISAWEICPLMKIKMVLKIDFGRETRCQSRKIVYEPESIVFHEHGLNQGASMSRALHVCKSLKDFHDDDVFVWPKFKESH